ncbi:MAG: UDP-4-amino-4-deoxy-L-arabinose--oxoglutarate aminotransferase [Candidatus Diapherotrites archaeon ADurb.Bin253]|nr:MAG: UDP-4-amino-4-deoxy-L-arabinose--oxoglutarate aminotransferase [Candidatus Diapherotrites archaeon ADurb.Bin253]
MAILTQKIYQSIRNVVWEGNFVPLHSPFFGKTEEKYVVDCIRSNFVSSVGEYVDKFEKAIREYTKTKYTILTVNGTSALHICLLLTDVKKDDEVLVPSMTFVATPNAVWYIGAVPHFVDVNKESLGIDPFKLDEYLSKIAEVQENKCYNKKTHRQIKAIIPMHTFGHPVDMDELTSVAERYKLTIIEDAAEALGSLYKNKHVGNFSKMAILSFNGNKIITTGGGGAVLTNNEDLAKKVKHLTTTAKKPHPWEYVHDMVGYNYRMPALNASLGLAQIEKLDEFVEKKRILAEKYKESLKDVEEIEFFVEPGYARSNYWLNAIILNKEYTDARDEILEETNKNGIMTRPVWKLMHKLEMFKDCPRMDLSVSESLEKRIINIPSSAHLIKD